MGEQEERPPLWRVMSDAWFTWVIVNRPDADRFATAAEIRAAADWLVPEDPEPPNGYAETSAGYRHTVWKIRDELRQLLLDEARKAEAGE